MKRFYCDICGKEDNYPWINLPLLQVSKEKVFDLCQDHKKALEEWIKEQKRVSAKTDKGEVS